MHLVTLVLISLKLSAYMWSHMEWMHLWLLRIEEETNRKICKIYLGSKISFSYFFFILLSSFLVPRNNNGFVIQLNVFESLRFLLSLQTYLPCEMFFIQLRTHFIQMNAQKSKISNPTNNITKFLFTWPIQKKNNTELHLHFIWNAYLCHYELDDAITTNLLLILFK